MVGKWTDRFIYWSTAVTLLCTGIMKQRVKCLLLYTVRKNLNRRTI